MSRLSTRPSNPDPRLSTLIPRLFREPLLHFLLIGAGLFLLFGWRGGPPSQMGGQIAIESRKIIVAQSDIDQLVETFTRTWQRSPTEAEVKNLIESFIRDEIYYREAKAIGLDRDDSVIRRRLRLKMEYIFEDIASQGEPTNEELLAYMKKHSDSYLEDPQIAFRHVYVNADEWGQGAEAHARKVLAQLEKGADPGSMGAPFLMEMEVGLLPLRNIKHQYGERFADGILKIEPGKWQGPIRSGYGLHLVFVSKFVPERLPEISEVADLVKRDWAVDRQKKLKDAAYAKLKERYIVEIEKPEKFETAKIDETSDRVVTK